jgi:hypothetical protein
MNIHSVIDEAGGGGVERKGVYLSTTSEPQPNSERKTLRCMFFELHSRVYRSVENEFIFLHHRRRRLHSGNKLPIEDSREALH